MQSLIKGIFHMKNDNFTDVKKQGKTTRDVNPSADESLRLSGHVLYKG
jgi:hypothetical protein